jgi:hypothetical protein
MDVAGGGYHSNDVPVSWANELMAKLGYCLQYVSRREAIFIPEDTSALHPKMSYADPSRQNDSLASFKLALASAQNKSGVGAGCQLEDDEGARRSAVKK